MHGEIEILHDDEGKHDDDEIQRCADTLLYDAQRAGIVSLSETSWNDSSELVWTVADRLCALSSSQRGVRWIEMTDPIERMNDVRDAVIRYAAENNEDDMI